MTGQIKVIYENSILLLLLLLISSQLVPMLLSAFQRCSLPTKSMKCPFKNFSDSWFEFSVKVCFSQHSFMVIILTNRPSEGHSLERGAAEGNCKNFRLQH
jgi:hypothetical protein